MGAGWQHTSLPENEAKKLPVSCKQLRVGCPGCAALGSAWDALNFGVVSAGARHTGRPTDRPS